MSGFFIPKNNTTTMTTMTNTPRIWVCCLASYNSGKLHGVWIDADQEPDEIWEEINLMLASSPEPKSEEWGIFDYENFFGIKLSEYEDIEKVSELAKLLAEHGKAYAAYIDHVGMDYATPEGFEELYMGCWGSEEDYAQYLWQEQGYMQELEKLGIHYYIDWERVARDLFINDYYSHQERYGEVYIFSRQ